MSSRAKRKRRMTANRAGEKISLRADDLGRRDLTCRSYSIAPETFDKATRSVEAVLATENMVRAFDMSTFDFVQEVLQMTGLRMPSTKQVPLLDTHDRGSIFSQLGSTRGLRVENGQLVGRRFFDSTDEGHKAEIKVREGHVTDGSIGYRVLKSERVSPGQTAHVNGRSYTAPPDMALRVATDWEIREDSLCPIGADGAAKIRAENQPDTPTGKESTMPATDSNTETKPAQQAAGQAQTEGTRSDAPAANPVAQGSAQQTPAPADAQRSQGDFDMAAAAEAALKKAHEKDAARAAAIRELGEMSHAPAEMVRKAIDEDQTVESARASFLENVRKTRPAPAFAPAVHVPDSDHTRADYEAALLLKAGSQMDAIVLREYGQQTVERAAKLRSIGFRDVFEAACRMENVVWPGPGFDDRHIRAALSTVSLPGILGNVANKGMLLAYQDTPVTARTLCRIGSLKDFKETPRYRLNDIGEVVEVKPGGEVSQGTLGEDSAGNKLSTQGKLVWLDRQTIINDDTGFLTDVPLGLARKALRSVDRNFYTRLLSNPTMADSKSLFSTGHANYLSGATSAMSVDAMKAGILKFQSQTDKEGYPIAVSPQYVLVPPALDFAANQIIASSMLVNAGTATAQNVPTNNPMLRYAFGQITSPWLSNAKLTGYSAAAWYLFGNPNQVDTFELAYLNGNDRPTVDQAEADLGRLAVGFRVYFDYGIRELDYKGMVKLAGA